MIQLHMAGVPPSLNNLYVATRGGGRALSADGRKYKNEIKTLLQQEFPKELMRLKKNTPYLVFFRFYFEHVENKGWAKGETDRYKRLDVSNRAKVVEDCVKDSGAYDDSQNLIVILEKRQGLPERTDIWLWDIEAETTPFDDAFRQLR